MEAYVGVIIAIVIIKAGIEMLIETLNEILGQRADSEITNKIKQILTAQPNVRGAYDLILYNYGPNKNYCSVHLELPDTMTVEEVDRLTRTAEIEVYRETGVILVGVGVYSYNTSDDEAVKIRNAIQDKVMSHDWALQFHGFYADTAKKTIRFDVVFSFDISREEGLQMLYKEVQEMYPEYKISIIPDVDISD